MIAEGGDSHSERAHERDEIDAAREASVVDAAMQALRCVAGVLPWPQYDQLLGQMMRAMQVGPVCLALNHFTHSHLPACSH